MKQFLITASTVLFATNFANAGSIKTKLMTHVELDKVAAGYVAPRGRDPYELASRAGNLNTYGIRGYTTKVAQVFRYAPPPKPIQVTAPAWDNASRRPGNGYTHFYNGYWHRP